jgi:hypothetical protein
MISHVFLVLLMSSTPPDAGSDAPRDAAIALARKTLQQQIRADESAIELEEATAVTWPDAGLGCPQKGMMYAQMIVSGYRVTLRAGGQSYEVHVGGGRAVMCPDASGRSRGGYLSSAAELSAKARRDLARRLDTSESTIEVKLVRPTTWPDAELGCASADATPVPSETKGFLIELVHEGQTYRYHTDMSRVRYCE